MGRTMQIAQGAGRLLEERSRQVAAPAPGPKQQPDEFIALLLLAAASVEDSMQAPSSTEAGAKPRQQAGSGSSSDDSSSTQSVLPGAQHAAVGQGRSKRRLAAKRARPWAALEAEPDAGSDDETEGRETPVLAGQQHRSPSDSPTVAGLRGSAAETALPVGAGQGPARGPENEAAFQLGVLHGAVAKQQGQGGGARGGRKVQAPAALAGRPKRLRSDSITIEYLDSLGCFDIPLPVAAVQLGFKSKTMIAKRCRDLGIETWPYRTRDSARKFLDGLQELLPRYVPEAEAAEVVDSARVRLEPYMTCFSAMELTKELEALRQRWYKLKNQQKSGWPEDRLKQEVLRLAGDLVLSAGSAEPASPPAATWDDGEDAPAATDDGEDAPAATEAAEGA